MEPGAANLMTHFGPVTAEGLPVFVRGEGCELWDREVNRYLDALSTLFCVNAGHGRTELADAAAAQMRELAYATTWDMVHPPALELAARIAALAPGDLDRVFFTSGGSESVESALKLVARITSSTASRGARRSSPASSPTTAPRRRARGHRPAVRAHARTSRSRPAAATSRTRTATAQPGRDPLWAADAIEPRILFEGPRPSRP